MLKIFLNVVTRDGPTWLGRRGRKFCNLDKDRQK